MKTHVRVLVCGDEQVGKSSFISTIVARHFPDRVPHVMADVSIPPEENIDDVYCTIVDSSALPDHRGQLVANLKNAGSIVLIYDVERMETLARLNSVWLPLIETHTKDVPVVIVRNKVDKLADDPELGGRSDEELRRQMAPLRERYRFFHTSLECSSITQHGLSQVFHHALSAALYPIAPLYDTKAKELRPKFERAVRRLFRIYDRDRDALLADAELNNFQYRSFNLLLSEMDIVALKKILTRVAERTERNVAPEALVVPASEQSEGGITVEGFLALMTLFIEKNQMKAPWKTLHAHDYDDSIKLLLPRTVLETSSASSSLSSSSAAAARAPAHGSGGSGGFFCLGRQVLSPEAEAFLVSLFKQFAFVAEASSTPLLTTEGQAEVFSVIPDPACAPWDEPRSVSEFGWRLDSFSDRGLFGRLRRAPGARVKDAMTLEAWIAHWQMLAIECPVLARAHLFYAGFYGEGERMLVPAPGTGRARKVAGERSSLQVYVLGARGSGRSRVLKAMRLGEDLLAPPQAVVTSGSSSSSGGGGGGGQTRSSAQGNATSGAPAVRPEAEPTLPQTCAAFACRRRSEGEGRSHSRSGSSPSTSSPSWCRLMSLSVTEVPEDHTESFLEHQASACELAVLVFDPSSMESLDYVIGLQADLPEDVPRLVIACDNSGRDQDESVVVRAENACQALELSAPLYVNPETREGFDGEGGLRQRLTDPDRPGMVPHAERRRKRRDFHRRLGTAALIAVLSIAVAAAGYYTLSLSAAKKSSGRDTRSTGADETDGCSEASGGEGVGGWGMGVRGALRSPVRVVRLAASVATDYWKWWRSGREAGGLSHAVGLVSSS